jgi:hypothetical protein
MNKTNEKINKLTQLAVDQYNIDEDIMIDAAQKAKRINNLAKDRRFSETDVFMSEGGIFVIVAYKDINSIEITILDDDTFDIFIESDRLLVSFKQHQSESNVQAALDFWGRIWDLSALYQESHSTIERGGQMPLPSSDATPEEYPYLPPIASNQRALNLVGS